MDAQLRPIDSFLIDHRKLQAGLYVSRRDKVGEHELVTYDIRVCAPYQDEPMHGAAAHTCEHILATYLRNICGRIIYFGPMGCLTGFYLIVQDMSDDEVKYMLASAFAYLKECEEKDIPGMSEKECGNWQFQNIEEARNIGERYYNILRNINKYTYD